MNHLHHTKSCCWTKTQLTSWYLSWYASRKLPYYSLLWIFNSVPAGFSGDGGWSVHQPCFNVMGCYEIQWQQFTQIWIHVFSSQTFQKPPKVLPAFFFLGETPQNTRRHPGNPTSGSLGSFKCWGPRSWVHHWVAWHLDGLNVWIRLKIWKHLYRCHVWKLGSKWLENGLPSSKTNMTIEISPFPRGNTSSNGGFSIAMFVYRRVQPSYTWGILGWKKPTDPITFDPSTSNGTS